MGRDHTQQETPDLFSTASSGEASPPATNEVSPAQKLRHLLPKGLSTAVKHLDEQEFDLLLAVTLAEAKRRGKSLPHTATDYSGSKRSSRPDKPPHPRQVDVATISLTRGQINAVLAAFKAGIKPSTIARQFRISRSDVRKVLASRI